ncbi:PE family protein [Mycobacterium heidelbergense]|uniref:Uncharacterized protein n=1 Tax=Mycobacterium heidelbergense TaxID=53376 RepID=A0A1X0D888_MYCHE|nr:PE family protein [Mycobacterium heidelbergense]MCV7052708.1 PE family protein [Mycobacterium heidelbergense]ORA68558.1 hypothetical protein BST25_21935 [Mycobacterium heidelbergense]BBZ48970.1 hypothetical protein MHEI_06870 [Mycobacterium heidelbergense]
MSAVIAAPELIAEAATDLAAIGSTVSVAHMVAVGPTAAVLPAAADEVSASIAHVFSLHAQDYQALAGQAVVFHEQFVQHLTASAGSYASAEVANAASFGPLAAIGSAAASTIGAVQGPVLNVFNTVADQSINVLTNLGNTVGNTLVIILLSPIAVLLSPILVYFLVLYLYEVYTGAITPF